MPTFQSTHGGLRSSSTGRSTSGRSRPATECYVLTIPRSAFRPVLTDSTCTAPSDSQAMLGVQRVRLVRLACSQLACSRTLGTIVTVLNRMGSDRDAGMLCATAKTPAPSCCE